MPFEHFTEVEAYKVPLFKAAGLPNLYGRDIVGSAPGTVTPLTSYYFRIEKGPEAVSPPYDHDESAIVIKGEITLKDETGKTATVKAGETFFIRSGSSITFSTESFGIAYKTGVRFPLPDE